MKQPDIATVYETFDGYRGDWPRSHDGPLLPTMRLPVIQKIDMSRDIDFSQPVSDIEYSIITFERKRLLNEQTGEYIEAIICNNIVIEPRKLRGTVIKL